MSNQLTFSNLFEFENFAQRNGFNTIEFEFVNLSGVTIKARWLDAYYGFITIPSAGEGFITVRQLADAGLAHIDFKVTGGVKS